MFQKKKWSNSNSYMIIRLSNGVHTHELFSIFTAFGNAAEFIFKIESRGPLLCLFCCQKEPALFTFMRISQFLIDNPLHFRKFSLKMLKIHQLS